MSTTGNTKLSTELNNAIKLIGDDHILCIIGNLREGGMRFNELQRSLGGINPTTLTDRLSKLETEGIVIKKKETVDKISVVYELTEKGIAILPVFKAITKFAERFR